MHHNIALSTIRETPGKEDPVHPDNSWPKTRAPGLALSTTPNTTHSWVHFPVLPTATKQVLQDPVQALSRIPTPVLTALAVGRGGRRHWLQAWLLPGGGGHKDIDLLLSLHGAQNDNQAC
jgi:hypothetical protein